MENEDIELKPLEGIGDEATDQTMKKAFSFSWEKPAGVTVAESEERAAEVLAEADKYVEATDVAPDEASTDEVEHTTPTAKAGLVDALSLTIDALQEVFAELEEAKVDTLSVAKRATEKATRAGIELDLSLLDDPFDAALQDVNRLLNTLEKQRNRARMAATV